MTLLDNFNRANGPLGSNWGAWAPAGTLATISSNAATSVAGGGFRRVDGRWAASLYGPQVEASLKLVAYTGAAGDNVEIFLRATTTNKDTASVYVAQFSDNDNAINYTAAGVFQYSLATDATVTYAVNDIVTYRIVGSVHKLLKNGVVVCEGNGDEILTEGSIGFELVMFAASECAVDDWSVDNLPDFGATSFLIPRAMIVR